MGWILLDLLPRQTDVWKVALCQFMRINRPSKTPNGKRGFSLNQFSPVHKAYEWVPWKQNKGYMSLPDLRGKDGRVLIQSRKLLLSVIKFAAIHNAISRSLQKPLITALSFENVSWWKTQNDLVTCSVGEEQEIWNDIKIWIRRGFSSCERLSRRPIVWNLWTADLSRAIRKFGRSFWTVSEMRIQGHPLFDSPWATRECSMLPKVVSWFLRERRFEPLCIHSFRSEVPLASTKNFQCPNEFFLVVPKSWSFERL